MLRGLPPADGTVNMSNWPSASEANTIARPSGDQRGAPVPVGALRNVIWTGLEPSASEINISQAPDRVLVNATRRPSGECCGWISALVEAMAMAGGDDAAKPGAERSMRQIFSSVKLRTYTSRTGFPGSERETAGITPSSPTNGTRADWPSPVADTRHRAALPAFCGLVAKRISLPFGIHVAVSGNRCEALMCLGSPAAVMSLRTGSTCSSPRAHVVRRRNSNDLPSAEREGFVSATTGDCGLVNCRLSPVSIETANKASGSPSPTVSVTIRHLLSAHHVR